MAIKPDIIVYDSQHNPLLVVEVRIKHGTDNEWATKMRRNMLLHNLLPKVPYFLLALPDHFYFWENNHQLSLNEKPTYALDPFLLLKSYVEESREQLNNLSAASFEILVWSWLEELTQANKLIQEADVDLAWLFESGLFDAIQQAPVTIV